QGIEFEAVLVCPHFQADGCECRKPRTGLAKDYLRDTDVDLASSAMVGDRETDLEFARNLGVRGVLVGGNGRDPDTWPQAVRVLIARQAQADRRTRETNITVRVGLDETAPIQVATGIGFFDHMLEQLAKHG